MTIEQDLSRALDILSFAAAGPWRFSENGNILGDMPAGYDDTREIAAVYSEHDDADLAPINAQAIIVAVNFLRAHGPALLSALADQRRLREAEVKEVYATREFGDGVLYLEDRLIGQRVAIVPLDQEGE